MLFTESQIQEVLEIIDFQHIFFCAGNISVDVLTQKDRDILKKYKIDPDKLKGGLTLFQQHYYFGRLASLLGKQTSEIDYSDFKKYVQRGQYNPLTKVEKATLSYLEKNAYNYIAKRRDVIKTETETLLTEANSLDTFSKVINEELKDKFENNKSIQETILDLGHRSGKWEVDLGRIVETECQNAYLYGKMQALNEKHKDENIKYFKHVYPGACKHCIRLYLTQGIGSQPRLFSYQELVNNGTNIGRKTREWKPVLGTVHPYCRCDLDWVSVDEEWNQKDKSFKIKPSIKQESKAIEGVIKIKVGDKTFKV